MNVYLVSEIFGGNIGLALTQSMTLTGNFQFGMRQWSELENQMTSVERVQEYIDLPSEVDDNTKYPPTNWPALGQIVFQEISLRYSPESSDILKGLSFKIHPKQKIGIVGRTGAGKSSLIQALFRLVDINGVILIDDVDTKMIPLNVLRSKISIIPQQPVLFSGTIRRNLDPFDEYSDEVTLYTNNIVLSNMSRFSLEKPIKTNNVSINFTRNIKKSSDTDNTY